jgi:hypothetical protein
MEHCLDVMSWVCRVPAKVPLALMCIAVLVPAWVAFAPHTGAKQVRIHKAQSRMPTLRSPVLDLHGADLCSDPRLAIAAKATLFSLQRSA